MEPKGQPAGIVQVQRARLDQLEAEVARLRGIKQIVRENIGDNITRPEVYHVAGQDTNHRLCLALIALDEWRAALEPQP